MRTNVEKKIIITSPVFPQNYCEYLVKSGFSINLVDNSKWSYQFISSQFKISVSFVFITIYQWHPGNDTTDPGWAEISRGSVPVSLEKMIHLLAAYDIISIS